LRTSVRGLTLSLRPQVDNALAKSIAEKLLGGK
jgi:hypothetical protein